MSRTTIIAALAIGCVRLCLGACTAQDAAKPHFHYAGPMSASMRVGAVPGRVTTGLPFAFIVTDKGASISPAQVDVTGPKWTGIATLSLDRAKYENGTLSGSVHLHNAGGTVLEGVRLDIVGATEEYRAVDNAGKQILKTRPQGAVLASPLLFGDVPDTQESDAVPLAVGGLAFKPETTKVTVKGVLTGLYFLGGFEVMKIRSSPAMDVDAQGRVYFTDGVGKSVVRCEANGIDPVVAAKLPDQCLGTAVDPKTGDVYASATNNAAIFQFASTGALKGKIEKKDGLDGYTNRLRVGRDGRLYSDMSGAIVQIVNGRAGPVLRQVAGERLGARLFDVGADGTLWICTSTSLFRSDIAGKGGSRVATGPDWHLGGITAPNACRIDASGQVYVTEGELGKEAARISVFDGSGKLVRTFGRGSSAPLTGRIHPGQVFRPTDIAFGPDGRVYILHTGDPISNVPLVLMFQPF